MNERSKLLGSESIGKLLFKLSAPATVGMMVHALYNLVDTIFVGRALGENSVQAIAGISIAFPVQMIIMSVALAIGIGGASIVSRSMGANDMKRARRTLGNVIALSVILSAVMTVLGTTFIYEILESFGTTETIMPYAFEYLETILYGTIFFSFALATNNIVRAEGNARVAMLTMVISAGMNILLDPIFIFGLDMGVKGAAIATVIAQAISAIYLVYYFLKGKSCLDIDLKDLLPERNIVKEMAAIGVSPFARQSSGSVVVIVLNSVLAIYGGDVAIAVYGIINRLFMFTFMPMFGVVQGLQPIVGFNYGAKNFDRVMESVRISTIVTTAMAVLGFIVLFLFPEQLFGIFSKDPQLINSGKVALRIMVLAIPLIGFQVIGAGLYQAMGKARPSFILSMSRQVLFLIPLVLIFPRFFELNGVWMAFPVSDALAFAITLVMVVREFKMLGKEKDMI